MMTLTFYLSSASPSPTSFTHHRYDKFHYYPRQVDDLEVVPRICQSNEYQAIAASLLFRKEQVKDTSVVTVSIATDRNSLGRMPTHIAQALCDDMRSSAQAEVIVFVNRLVLEDCPEKWLLVLTMTGEFE